MRKQIAMKCISLRRLLDRSWLFGLSLWCVQNNQVALHLWYKLHSHTYSLTMKITKLNVTFSTFFVQLWFWILALTWNCWKDNEQTWINYASLVPPELQVGRSKRFKHLVQYIVACRFIKSEMRCVGLDFGLRKKKSIFFLPQCVIITSSA